MNREEATRSPLLKATRYFAEVTERLVQPNGLKLRNAAPEIDQTSGEPFSRFRRGAGAVGREARPAHGFESADHRSEFAECLRRRVVPLKFAYTGSAAFAHDRLSHSSGYQSVIGPAQDEAAVFTKALLQEGRPQMVEIGPGGGAHSLAFFQAMADGAVPRRYLALDFSSTLLGIARGRIAAGPKRPDRIDTGQWDVEGGPSREIDRWRDGGDPLAICFFGNTIGNVEDPGRVLSNIAISARTGDTLVLSTTKLPESADEAEILGPYTNEVFRDAILEVFRVAGIDVADIRLDITLEPGVVKGSVECLNRIEFDGVVLEKGEHVRCFISRRFLSINVRSLLDNTGWVITDELDRNDHFIVAATRK
jgi:L-histidine Nalpha-methyltransferase